MIEERILRSYKLTEIQNDVLVKLEDVNLEDERT